MSKHNRKRRLSEQRATDEAVDLKPEIEAVLDELRNEGNATSRKEVKRKLRERLRLSKAELSALRATVNAAIALRWTVQPRVRAKTGAEKGKVQLLHLCDDLHFEIAGFLLPAEVFGVLAATCRWFRALLWAAPFVKRYCARVMHWSHALRSAETLQCGDETRRFVLNHANSSCRFCGRVSAIETHQWTYKRLGATPRNFNERMSTLWIPRFANTCIDCCLKREDSSELRLITAEFAVRNFALHFASVKTLPRFIHPFAGFENQLFKPMDCCHCHCSAQCQVETIERLTASRSTVDRFTRKRVPPLVLLKNAEDLAIDIFGTAHLSEIQATYNAAEIGHLQTDRSRVLLAKVKELKRRVLGAEVITEEFDKLDDSEIRSQWQSFLSKFADGFVLFEGSHRSDLVESLGRESLHLRAPFEELRNDFCEHLREVCARRKRIANVGREQLIAQLFADTDFHSHYR